MTKTLFLGIGLVATLLFVSSTTTSWSWSWSPRNSLRPQHEETRRLEDDPWEPGSRIYKKFSDGWYLGVITEYDWETEVYSVVYEDGDSATFSWDSEELDELVYNAENYEPWEEGTPVLNGETGNTGVIEGFVNWEYIIKWDSGGTDSYTKLREVDSFVEASKRSFEPPEEGTATDEPTDEGTATDEPTEDGTATDEPTEEGTATYEPTDELTGTYGPTSTEPPVSEISNNGGTGIADSLRSSLGFAASDADSTSGPNFIFLGAGVVLVVAALLVIRSRRVAKRNRLQTQIIINEYKDDLELPEIQ